MSIKFDQALIGYINLFESITRTNVKDCFNNGKLTFIVDQGQIGKAIGIKAQNIKRVEKMLKKRIRVVEFNSDVKQFIKNLIYPLKPKEVQEEENIITIVAEDIKMRGQLIGRDKRNIKNLQEVVNKYFNVEIKVK